MKRLLFLFFLIVAFIFSVNTSLAQSKKYIKTKKISPAHEWFKKVFLIMKMEITILQ